MEYFKTNNVRTNLLVYVHNESQDYLKKSSVKINSELPQQIVKKNDQFQFENKFDNPIFTGSFNRKSKCHTTKVVRQSGFFSNFMKEKDAMVNCKNFMLDHNDGLEEEFRKLRTSRRSENLNSSVLELTSLKFAEFLTNKKISCAHKKLFKFSDNSFIKKNRKLSSDSNYNNNSFNLKLLNDDEKRKMKILEGYDKLTKITKKLKNGKGTERRDDNLHKLLSNGKSGKQLAKEKLYEELFELLEHKGINFGNSKKNRRSSCKSLGQVFFKTNSFSNSSIPQILEDRAEEMKAAGKNRKFHKKMGSDCDIFTNIDSEINLEDLEISKIKINNNNAKCKINGFHIFKETKLNSHTQLSSNSLFSPNSTKENSRINSKLPSRSNFNIQIGKISNENNEMKETESECDKTLSVIQLKPTFSIYDSFPYSL